MENNDSLLKTLELKLNNYYKNKRKIQDKNKSIIEDRIKLVKEIGNTKNINDILEAEQIITEYELRVHGCNEHSVLQTLNKIFKELDKALKTLSIVMDKEKYNIFNEAYPLGNRIHGLPKDAFHAFINSHKMRLEKRQPALISGEAYLLLQERCNNLIIAGKEYMSLQAKALGIDLSKKNK